MPLKPVSKSQDASVIERQGHITNRIRLAELPEQAIHWLNPLCSSWEHAVVLQCSMHSCRRNFLSYLGKSKIYIMTHESSVQLYIFSLAENARKCYSMLERWGLFGVRLGLRACCDNAASWGRSTSRWNSAVVMVLQFFFLLCYNEIDIRTFETNTNIVYHRNLLYGI